ncbi:hypothetical protein [Ruficoccus sp. ZRK36]|uniref:hypothetical protein n=1 Tax=Ruficoccus sp. ZRK36 TaxID=2866311 RepID=UPI001C7315D2|nr:hypothetical protein [Ruficoccus sp. ZRK36]QYY37394.1 hypothetical protein K0V07_07880 [Ruficoccus sp. ZRK36]
MRRDPRQIPSLPAEKRRFKRPTVAMISRSGRFGNRLQCTAYTLATALEYGFRVKLYSLESYDTSLVHYAGHPIRKHWRRLQRKILDWTLKSPFLQRLLRCQILEGTKAEPLLLSSPESLAAVFNCRLTLLPSFYTYCHPAILQKHRAQLQELLALKPSNAERQYLEQVRAEAEDILVGVHIRRGDYREFGGGEFYFSLDQYAQLAKSLVSNLGGRKATFIACSDEPIPTDAFPGVDWKPGPGSLTGDLYALSVCDYVMGPPSTFNHWSAFIAGIPRYEITQESQTLRLEDFQPVDDLYSQGYWENPAG